MGKSTLAEEFIAHLNLPTYKLIGQPPAKVNRTTTELSNFARQLKEQFNIQKPSFADWDDAFSTLGDLVNHGNCILLIYEINWLGKTTYKWNLMNGDFSKKDAVYAITDPYLRFYYKAVLPHKAKIEQGRGSLPDNIDSLLGLQFEYVMQDNLKPIYKILGINESDIINEAPYQAKGIQIDWLIETKRNFCILEFQFKLHPLDADVVRNMDKKISRIQIPENKSIRTAVVHVNGVKDTMEQSAIIGHCINLLQPDLITNKKELNCKSPNFHRKRPHQNRLR
ncbi:hypothetical protein [Agaribacter flavus]|uniref:Uncharacterized protein n=1 Tax=Agaribacter flavus TaxID=1902781 RepID=A0ABV7FRG9_9ALTE